MKSILSKVKELKLKEEKNCDKDKPEEKIKRKMSKDDDKSRKSSKEEKMKEKMAKEEEKNRDKMTKEEEKNKEMKDKLLGIGFSNEVSTLLTMHKQKKVDEVS